MILLQSESKEYLRLPFPLMGCLDFKEGHLLARILHKVIDESRGNLTLIYTIR